VNGTVADVVYLGSVTQLVVELPTGERLTVHRLNDELGVSDPSPGDRVALRWAADHSYVIGSDVANSAAVAVDEQPSAPAGASGAGRRAGR
jgi:hypothetical protein